MTRKTKKLQEVCPPSFHTGPSEKFQFDCCNERLFDNRIIGLLSVCSRNLWKLGFSNFRDFRSFKSFGRFSLGYRGFDFVSIKLRLYKLSVSLTNFLRECFCNGDAIQRTYVGPVSVEQRHCCKNIQEDNLRDLTVSL